jgi:CRISPR system Cascade subunit CasB
MSQQATDEWRFVQALERLVERKDRAALARLRRGLGKTPGEMGEAHAYVVPYLANDAPEWREDAFYLVGTLFALHPRPWGSGDDGARYTNLGWSFARLTGATESESIEKRFVALLNAHRDDLDQHLRGAIGLLKAHEVPVNWLQLLRDVQHWGTESRSVQRTWARAFWQRARPEDEAGPQQASEAAGVAAGE